jgi:hypothetical protein
VQEQSVNLICGAAIALSGAYIGHFLTKARERAAWERSTRIKEWQELLETLSGAYMTLLRLPDHYSTTSVEEYNVKKADALADVDVMLATRIFISDAVELLLVRLRWAASAEAFHKRPDKPSFMAAYQSLHKDIVAKAKNHKVDIRCSFAYTPTMRVGGYNKAIDYAKLGPTLVIASSIVLALRTAR